MENKKVKIGVMGGIGSFSEEAANYYCKKQGIEKYQLEYLITADNVLQSLNEDKVDLGIIGLFNTISGPVLTSLAAMGKCNFEVKDSITIDIRQNILAKSGARVEEITTIVSQLPALDQCRNYLQENFPNAEKMEYKDTAEAARDIAEGRLPKTAAAICNLSCAKLYNLQVLGESIQDNKNNRTTFIIVAK